MDTKSVHLLLPGETEYMSNIRVILADDHQLVRKGFHALIQTMEGIEVIAEAGNGSKALELVESLHPDILLLDLIMPEMNGIELLEVLQDRAAQVRVICLSLHDNEEYIRRTLQLGASGFLLKTSEPEELERAIHSVHAGGKYLASEVSDRLVSTFFPGSEPNPSSLSLLTNRQRQILRLVAEGQSTKTIAKKLGLSVKTVEMHRGHIMKALDIKGVAGLTKFAIKHGLISG